MLDANRIKPPIAQKRAVLLTLAALLLGLLFPLPAFSMLLLTEDQFDQDNPVISGNNVVWLDWRNGISELWLHDVAAGTQRGLPLDGAGLNDPINGFPTVWSVSDKLIAWQDYRNSESSRVYRCDLPCDNPASAKPVTTATGGPQRSPAAWDDKIAWVEDDLVLLDPARPGPTTISTRQALDLRPSFHGGLLAWYAQDTQGIDSAIVVWDTDWPTGRTPQAVHPIGSTNFNPMILPSIWRDPNNPAIVRLAWAERSCAESECSNANDDFNRNIYYLELAYVGSTFTRVVGPEPLAGDIAPLGNQWGVKLFGDYIVWDDWSANRILAYHIPTKKRFALINYLGSPPNLSLDGDNLVWAQAADGNSDGEEIVFESLAGSGIASVGHSSELAWQRLPTTLTWSAPLGVAAVQGYSLDLGQKPIPSLRQVVDVACLPVCSDSQLTQTYSGLADGIWYFQVRAKTEEGAWGPAGSYRLQLDSTPPSIEAGLDQTISAGGSVRLQGTASDGRSGLQAGSESWSFSDGTSLNGVQVDKSFPNAGTYIATFSAKDQAGNLGSDSLTVKVVSFTLPGPTGGTTATTTPPPSGSVIQQPAFSSPLSTSPSSAMPANAQLQQAASKKPRPLSPFTSVWMYPNPFYPGQNAFFVQKDTGKRVSLRATSFCFNLNTTGHVYVSLFNSKGFLGRMYAKPYFINNRMFNRYLGPGRYYVGWTGTLNGKLLPPGTYKYVLTASNGSVARTYQGTVTLSR